PGVIVLENPHCQSGGRVLPASYIKEVRELADERGLPLHLDGARIFNAAIASKRSPAEMAKDFDSIMLACRKDSPLHLALCEMVMPVRSASQFL
ncbi:beta-eliminating lyase-related protein, partial [Mesorhizobium sp. M0586]|uniref:beta-eliminating lyase-related protein n=1 Tax=unclassified Mesorhizobium TaxID=325217 RepID=UPI00333B3B84